MSQAMWGAAYSCSSISPTPFKMEHIIALARIGVDCWDTNALPLR